MLLTRNRDIPGVIGKIGAVIGDSKTNISRFNLGRREPGGEAMAVIETDAPVDDTLVEKLRALDEVIIVKRIEL
jgi:D-3-phosphoglycerate dehydrogenase